LHLPIKFMSQKELVLDEFHGDIGAKNPFQGLT